jgi:hypothetical protein
VVLRVNSAELAALPWEAMYDAEAAGYVCRREPLVRHVPVASAPAPLRVRPPLRILAVAASPRGLPALDVEREQAQLTRALTGPIERGEVELRWAEEATWGALQHLLLSDRWHAVHFIGHGDFDPEAGEGFLALVGADGFANRVEAGRFADLLREASPMPRLVVLNSCASAASGARNLFSGTAAALVRSGVSAVAAMQFTITDPAAIAFSRGFYTAVAQGRGVDEAVRSGRVAILGTSRNTLEWVTPVLYLRGEYARLFAVAAVSESAIRRGRSADAAASATTGTGHDPHRPPSPSSSTTPESGRRVDGISVEQAAADLAGTVRQTWIREAAHRGLTSPLPIAVRMRSADPRITAHPAQWIVITDIGAEDGPSGVALTGTAANVAAIYSRISTGRLVIVGEAGGGKTGAAVLLLLSLCDTPRSDGRIPVWFPLGSWDPNTASVEQWMTEQLITTYGTPRVAALALVHSGRVLPVMDGLDEITEDHRPAAMAALHGLGTTPMVLTCRTNEYAAAAAERVLAAAAVVEVAPVDPATATVYLSHSGATDAHRWDPVLTSLGSAIPNPCQEALRSPLMLSLARIVYQASTSQPTELTTYTTAAQVEDRLLDWLIPAVYGREPTDTTADDARRWLTFFADHLPTLGPGAIAWWRLPRCVPGPHLRIAAAFAYGLPASLWTWIFASVFAPLGWSWSDSLKVALATGVIVSLGGARAGAVLSEPSRWRRPTRRDFGHGLTHGIKPGLAAGLAAGLWSGLAVGLLDPPTYGLQARVSDAVDAAIGVGLPFAFVAVIALGLAEAFSRRQSDAVTPLAAFRTDRKAVRIVGVLTGLVAGPVTASLGAVVLQLQGVTPSVFSQPGMVSGLGEILILAAFFALLIGLGVALTTALWFGLRRSSSWWYGIAVVLLAPRRVVPVRPLQFLEDAHRRGVLRQAGMVYEFRHARLVERIRSSPERIASPRNTVS